MRLTGEELDKEVRCLRNEGQDGAANVIQALRVELAEARKECAPPHLRQRIEELKRDGDKKEIAWRTEVQKNWQLEQQLAAARAELQSLKKEYDEEVISHDIEETDLKQKLEMARAEIERLQRSE